MPTPNEITEASHVVDSSPVEEPAAPAGEQTETLNTPVEDGETEQKLVEEKQEAAADVALPETEPAAPAKEMESLAIAVDDEKEVDTAEVTAQPEVTAESPEVTETPEEEKVAIVEESNTPAEEEDPYKHLKVTLTLPSEDTFVSKEENEEKPTEKEKIHAEDEKPVPDKAKDEKERDSDSGNGSAADNSSVDLNLSISSFLSKTKEPGSVSIQVTATIHTVKDEVQNVEEESMALSMTPFRI